MDKFLTPFLIFLAALGLAAVLGLIYWNYQVISANNEIGLLEKEGLEIQATLLEKEQKKASIFKGGMAQYWMTYAYEVAGAKFERTQRVMPEVFEHYKVGQSVPILHLANQPEVSNIKDNSPFFYDLLLIAGIDILLIIGIVYTRLPNKLNFRAG